MKAFGISGFLVAVWSAGCTGPLGGTCPACPAPQVCDLRTQLCAAPTSTVVISIGAPRDGAVITGSTVNLSGQVVPAQDVTLLAYLVDGQDSWTEMGLNSGAFDAVVPLPKGTDQSLNVTVRLADTTGAVAQAVSAIRVDNP
ncbi:MAG: hypothetical protein ACKVPX_13160 [Myxococcaceae bacterium]